jgi:hypothetical protein
MLSHPLAFIKTVNHLSHFSIVFGRISIKNSKTSGFGRTMNKKFGFKSNTQFINQLVWTQSAAQYASQKDTKPKSGFNNQSKILGGSVTQTSKHFLPP